jgi:hypothetical protein
VVSEFVESYKVKTGTYSILQLTEVLSFTSIRL